MVSSTVKERILIHLYPYYKLKSKIEVPYEISQPGIADAVGVSRPHLSQEIRKIVEDETGLIEEDIKRVKGMKRKRKVYFLTPKGVRKAQYLIKKFNGKKITILTPEGKSEVMVKDIDQYIKGDNPLLTSLSRVNDEGVLDLTKVDDIEEDIFIDRKKEMNFLKRTLKEVEEEGGMVLFVVGDSGIGKTRLISEFKKYSKKKGFVFLSGKAYFESSDPYLPFKKAFEEFTKNKDTHFQLTSIYPGKSGPRAEDKKMFDYQRRATFFEIAEDIRILAKKKPLLIFLDDIQWADAATLQLTHYLSENLLDSKVLVIGAFRPRDVKMNDLLKEVRQRMRRERIYNELELKPLKWKHTKKIITAMLGVSSVPTDFVKLLHDLSEGNPLFIKECIKRLMEEGNLDPKKNRYPDDPKAINIPNIIINIIERRFDQLSDDTRRILHLGCVIGEEIPFDLLLNTCGMEELDAFDHIDVLLGTNLWKELPEEEMFAFTHALVHLAAYNSIPDIKKKRLHKTVAEKIEELHKNNLVDYYSDLSNHFENAGNTDKAISYYYKAGKRAEEVYAQEDALKMYQEALDLWDKEKGDIGFKLLENLGDVNSLLGNLSSSREHYERIVEETDDTSRIQRMYRKIARTWETQGDFEKAEELVDRALKTYDEDPVETCRLYEVKGWTLMQKGDFEGAGEMFEKEKELSKDFCDEKLQSNSNHNLGTLMIHKGKYEEANKYLKEALKIREKIGDKRSIAKSLNNIGVVYKCRGEINKALDTYKRCLEIEKDIGDKGGMAAILANLGTLQYMNDELTEAEENFDRALKIFKSIGDKRGMAMATNNLGIVHLDMGDLDQAIEYQTKGLSLRKEMGDKQGWAMSLGFMSNVHILKGELKQAEEYVNQASDLLNEIGDMKGVAMVNSLQGEIKKERGEIDEAIRLYEKSYDFHKKIGEKYENIEICGYLGELFIKSGDLKKARKRIDEGLRISREVGTTLGEMVCMRISGTAFREEGDLERSLKELNQVVETLEKSNKEIELARAYYELGKTHLEANDIEMGIRNLSIAKDKFEEMGMNPWSERAEKLIDDL